MERYGLKLVYIESNHGKNKNYVTKLSNGMCLFGKIEEAIEFDEKSANKIQLFLERNLGNAFVVESTKKDSGLQA